MYSFGRVAATTNLVLAIQHSIEVTIFLTVTTERYVAFTVRDIQYDSLHTCTN